MGIEEEIAAHKMAQEAAGLKADEYVTEELLEELHARMLQLAAEQKFEEAAQVRDEIARLKGQPVATPQVKKPRGRRKRTQS
jgi:excinuclease ABC subunit B